MNIDNYHTENIYRKKKKQVEDTYLYTKFNLINSRNQVDMLRIRMNYVLHSYFLFVDRNVEQVEYHYVLYPNKSMKSNPERNI